MVFLKKVLVPAVILCMTMFIAGCGDDEDDNKSPTGPSGNANVVGTWETGAEGVTISIKYNENKSYTFSVKAEDMALYTENGTYTVNGNSVTMTCSSCTAMGMGTECGDPTTATVSGNTLTASYEDEPFTLTKK